MMVGVVRYTLICMVSLCIAMVSVSGQAPCTLSNVPLQQNFDIDLFLGKWYEIEWVSPAYMDAGELWINYYHVYSADEYGVVTGYYSGKDSNTAQCFLGGLAVLKSTDHPAKMLLYNEQKRKVMYDYWIVSTDYTSYAIAYGCLNRAPDSNDTCATARSWLWGRSRSLPESVKVNARTIFESLCMNLTLLYATGWRGDECIPDVSGFAERVNTDRVSFLFPLLTVVFVLSRSFCC
ncbi:retinol-binding protein 4-A-like [Littorina saxatilis]|uniref:Lipocalin/cytosolic fatty-acid binding domain-containing protein n=1 Tax=Littorina saxatilis TaxID=31220 RepID=A0AAN9AMS6_9CAEN